MMFNCTGIEMGSENIKNTDNSYHSRISIYIFIKWNSLTILQPNYSVLT